MHPSVSALLHHGRQREFLDCFLRFRLKSQFCGYFCCCIQAAREILLPFALAGDLQRMIGMNNTHTQADSSLIPFTNAVRQLARERNYRVKLMFDFRKWWQKKKNTLCVWLHADRWDENLERGKTNLLDSQRGIARNFYALYFRTIKPIDSYPIHSFWRLE